MTAPEAVETAFCEAARLVPGIAAALEYEPGPEALPALPCVAMLWSGLTQDDRETGPATDNTWTWRVNLYVRLGDFVAPQRELKALVPALLRITRTDPGLAGTCEWAEIGDEGQEPTFATERALGYVAKSLRLIAHTHET